jgi:beta-glucanase (GH16 family)
VRLARHAMVAAVVSALLTGTATAASAATAATRAGVVDSAVSATSGQEIVGNSSAATGLTGWSAHSSAGAVTVDRLTGITGPFSDTTAVRFSRAAVTESWAMGLTALTVPATSFTVGRTYRMRAWVRDLKASGRPIGLLLANEHYAHRPTEVTQFGAFTDTAWHLITRTFVATAPASADTALYLSLPASGAIDFQVAAASVAAVTAFLPARTTAAPARTVTFTGTSGAAPDSRIWNYEVGGHGWGNDEMQSYTASRTNSRLTGTGRLSLIARRETVTGPDGIQRQYSSARLTTKGKLTVAPGSYVEATLTAPVGSGLWPAFWLLGANVDTVGWPASGELDAFEGWGSEPTVAHVAAHTASTRDASADQPYGWGEAGGTTTLPTGVAAAPHRYGVYFDDQVIRFFVDRTPTMTVWASDAAAAGRSWPFGRPMYLLLNVAISRSVTAATGFPRTMTVDGISVWSGGVPR